MFGNHHYTNHWTFFALFNHVITIVNHHSTYLLLSPKKGPPADIQAFFLPSSFTITEYYHELILASRHRLVEASGSVLQIVGSATPGWEPTRWNNDVSQGSSGRPLGTYIILYSWNDVQCMRIRMFLLNLVCFLFSGARYTNAADQCSKSKGHMIIILEYYM